MSIFKKIRSLIDRPQNSNAVIDKINPRLRSSKLDDFIRELMNHGYWISSTNPIIQISAGARTIQIYLKDNIPTLFLTEEDLDNDGSIHPIYKSTKELPLSKKSISKAKRFLGMK